jgi:subtilisin family serine protease
MPRKESTQPNLPPVVYAEASVKSQGGVSLFDSPETITSENVQNFYSDNQLTRSAVDKLRTEGFNVLAVGDTTITIGAPAEVYERVFRTKIVAEERPAIKSFGIEDTATFLDSPDTEMPGLVRVDKSPLAGVLEGVALNEPVYYFAAMPIPTVVPPAPLVGPWAPSALAPQKAYWHLDVPGEVALAINAERAHRAGFTGRGVKVVSVDSGWYRHPYFVERGYRASPVVLGPATSNPDHDEHGHGTGESANIFAVAPDVEFTMVKINFVNAVGAFNVACALKPHVITCSWGSSVQSGPLSASNVTLAAAVANAVLNGIIVIFSAGNGQWGFPGQHPDVISAGGVYMHPNGSVEATPYASGFVSNVYPGRRSPDVCGLVGLPPRAQYIMLPVEPGDTLDRDLSGGAHPNGDETTNVDGWAAFSGTSAAAPQLAGTVALMKQACGHLTPAAVKAILKSTAYDVTTGSSNPATGGHPAGPGPDLATGSGLADATKATAVARLRCLIRPPVTQVPPVVRPIRPEHVPEASLDESDVIALESMFLAD